MFFNDHAWMEDTSIGEIADKFLSKYPYAFEDYGYDIFEEREIRFLNSKETIEYAPPGDCAYRRRQ